MNILEIFPSAVFVDNNKELLEETNLIFDKFKTYFIGNDLEFKTTLSRYNPYKAKVTIDFLENQLLTNLTQYIENSVFKYLEIQGYENYEIKIINLWLNEMTSQQSHELHHHYGYTFSGCYYCKCPKDSNIIQLVNPMKSSFSHRLHNKKITNNLNAETCEIEVEEGSLIIFPSYLQHGVPIQTFNDFRRSVAFDIVVI